MIFGAFDGTRECAIAAGDKTDDHFGRHAERRRAFGSVEHSVAAGCARADINEPAAAAQMRESHIAAAIRPDYAALTVPTLVVHGELDHIVPVQAAHYVAGAIAGATLEVLPGAGHVPSVTQPAALVDVIERWWAGVAPQA